MDRIGKKFVVETSGKSHGKQMDTIVSGCPVGIKVSREDIQKELNRRRPGQNKLVSPRNELDNVKILSGIKNGKTTGGKIRMVVMNKDIDSSKYQTNILRPGHSDLTQFLKNGKVESGGGRLSGRETVCRVMAGGVAKKLLEREGARIIGCSKEIGGIKGRSLDLSRIEAEQKRIESNQVRSLSNSKKMAERILSAKEKGDSVGGIIEVVCLGVPAGIGELVFDKLDADLAKAMMSIGSVKGVEIGLGFEVSRLEGSENNDSIRIKNGEIVTETNNAGGILGGVSNGMPIVIRIAVKPTSSIGKVQKTADVSKMKNCEVQIEGRHDPCICPRVVPVAESMAAIVLADHLLRRKND